MHAVQGAYVVALGGNAISRDDEEGNVAQQFAHTREAAAQLAPLVESGRGLVVTHGNGPQVGNVLRRVELAAHELYTLPLDVCGAHTQGGMGYMIAQCLNNELDRRGVARRASALVTTVEVDPRDPELHHPTKPIGKFYPRERAEDIQRRTGWLMREFPGHGFRRVVPSPRPRAVVEIELIARLVRAGDVLVAGGGGGIPVTRAADGSYSGVEAVIDKDRTAALLAAGVDADALVIATDVDRVALDFSTPRPRFLEQLTLEQAERHLHAGQFPEGSMGPKIEAAITFLRGSARRDAFVLVCDLFRLEAAIAGRAGTRVVRS